MQVQDEQRKNFLTLLLALASDGSKLPFLTVLYPLSDDSLYTLYLYGSVHTVEINYKHIIGTGSKESLISPPVTPYTPAVSGFWLLLLPFIRSKTTLKLSRHADYGLFLAQVCG